MELVILGCGYTGRRVAKRFLARGARIVATARHPERLTGLGVEPFHLDTADPGTIQSLAIPPGATVLYSIPTAAADSAIAERLTAAARVVYLSTTGVYGRQFLVDENTPPAPGNAAAHHRIAVEQALAAVTPSLLVLRPAAIYGPGRGVHLRMRAGTYSLQGGGNNWISRIHVDDLATLVEAALLSDCTGAYPVADDEPCPARQIAAFCAERLGLAMPPVSPDGPRSDRRVDGGAIRRLLGVPLKYPSYRTGIPASIVEENQCLLSSC